MGFHCTQASAAHSQPHTVLAASPFRADVCRFSRLADEAILGRAGLSPAAPPTAPPTRAAYAVAGLAATTEVERLAEAVVGLSSAADTLPRSQGSPPVGKPPPGVPIIGAWLPIALLGRELEPACAPSALNGTHAKIPTSRHSTGIGGVVSHYRCHGAVFGIHLSTDPY